MKLEQSRTGQSGIDRLDTVGHTASGAPVNSNDYLYFNGSFTGNSGEDTDIYVYDGWNLIARVRSTLLSSSSYYSATTGLPTNVYWDSADLVSYGWTSGRLTTKATYRNYLTILSTTQSYDNFGRLAAVSSSASSLGTVSSHAYLYNALSQRTKATVEDLSWWLYDSYNERGELTEASKRWYGGAGLRYLGRTYRYGYDSIGNRTSAYSGGDSAGNGTRAFYYTANNLNQLTGIANPDSFDVAGMSIHPTVKVNTVNAARQDDYYHRELAHTGRPGFLGVTVQSYDAQGQPAGSPETGEVYVPRASETLNYDADGNLLGDGRWIYGWNAEDRLISMETQPQAVSGIPAAQSVKLLFDYDWMGRRIRKRVYQPASAGTPVRTERYAWDGWLCAAKLDGAQTEAYVWGVDLAGSLSATGGVGGLAAILDLNGESGTISGVHFPAYDGNGNVMALVSDVSGGPVLTARYEYDPFGNELRRSGSHAENNPWRFSTKWTDRESGLSYYGYRYYDPVRGRWLNRDPIGEKGGRKSIFFREECSNEVY